MKVNKFLAFAAMAATALSLGACSDDDDDNEGGDEPTPEVKVESVTLSSTTLEVSVGSSASLTAILSPSNATGTVSWTTSDATVATVEAGKVTGVKAGKATITAAVGDIKGECLVTVSDGNPGNNPTLDGSDYYVFQLDGTTFDANTSKIKMDLRPDDETKFLYVWEGTYEAGSTTGKNFFNLAEGWVALTVGSVGWSGAGLCYGTADSPMDLSALYDIYAHADEYVFHIAMKSTDDAAHCLILYGQDSEAKFGLGGSYVDNGVTYNSIGSFDRDGEWHELELPMSKVIEAGVVYPETWKPTGGENLVAFLSGGKAGVTLEYDAMYIYKPAKK